MSYLGNQPNSAAFLTDQFSGNGSTTAWTLSTAPAGTTSILVSVSGILQDPTTYSVVGTTLTLGGAAPTGTGNISVRYLGIPAAGVVTTAYRTVTEFTATANQTTFTPPSYDVSYINVFRNGVRLGNDDYTASNGTTIILVDAAISGDLITVERFQISSIVGAIPNVTGAVSSSNIQSSVTLVTPNLGTPSAINLTNATSLPSTALPSGSIVQVVNSIKTNAEVISLGSNIWTSVSGISASITPRSSTNKILVLLNVGIQGQGGVSVSRGRVVRNGTAIAVGDASSNRPQSIGQVYLYMPGSIEGGYTQGVISLSYLDSPTSASAQTYQFQVGGDNSGYVYINRTQNDRDTNYVDARGVSTITLMEVVA